ncbi:MAG: hypothetical protein ABEK12_01390, partial [Candidatus Nanohaloarchaea archaeon]
MAWFGSDDEEMDEEERQRREDIDELLEKYDNRFEKMGVEKREGRIESREYREYKEAEREARQRNWYERLVDRTAFFRFTFDDMEQDHVNAINLLGWKIDADQIAPAALVIGGLTLIASIALMMLPI